jgi:preprotein translocase subunit Sss1
MDDFQEAWFGEGLEEEPEESTKAYYDMLSLAQKPLHEKIMVLQLDAIGCLMVFKS